MFAAASPQPFPGASGSDERRYTEVSSASLLRAAAARPAPARFRPESGSEEPEGPDDAARDADTERVGVLLLNLGGPETLSDVQPFLYNLFADPDIIRLPPAVAFLQKPLAGFISKARAPKVRLYPSAAGGQLQAHAREQPLRKPCAALRRCHPRRARLGCAGLRVRRRGVRACRVAPVRAPRRLRAPRDAHRALTWRVLPPRRAARRAGRATRPSAAARRCGRPPRSRRVPFARDARLLRKHALTHWPPPTSPLAPQADALRAALASKGTPAKVYVAMRYWRPFTEEAVAQIKRDRITRLVVLPLYPQFSISTSGSSLRLLEALFREDEYLSRMKHTVIPSWYQRRGYVVAMADLIQTELAKAFPPDVPPALGGGGSANIFFSAHGVPLSYVSDAGDPYKEEIEECVKLIMAELRARGVSNPHTLAYQSRVGPVEWLKPYTDATIRELGEQGTPALLAVPISFVSEHIETLEEIDCEYRELAHEVGIKGWGRVPALGVNPTFIGDLADAVLEALPHTGTMPSMAPPSAGAAALVPLGSVEDLLATYDGERLRLPPPIVVWRWGWTRSAEMWNGRLAMLAILSLLALEAGTGQGVLHTVGLL